MKSPTDTIDSGVAGLQTPASTTTAQFTAPNSASLLLTSQQQQQAAVADDILGLPRTRTLPASIFSSNYQQRASFSGSSTVSSNLHQYRSLHHSFNYRNSTSSNNTGVGSGNASQQQQQYSSSQFLAVPGIDGPTTAAAASSSTSPITSPNSNNNSLTPINDDGTVPLMAPSSTEFATLVPRAKSTFDLSSPSKIGSMNANPSFATGSNTIRLPKSGSSSPTSSANYNPPPHMVHHHYHQHPYPQQPPLSPSSSDNSMNPLRRAYSCPTKPTPKLPPFETTEFIAYTLFRIWHRIPPQATPNPQACSGLCNKLHQLLCRTGVGMSCLILSLLYVTRLRQATPDTEPIALGSEYRVLVTCLVLAQKWLKDDRYSNSYWSRVSAMQLSVLNAMEGAVLDKIAWRCHVTKEEFEKFRLVVKMLGGEQTRRIIALRKNKSMVSVMMDSSSTAPDSSTLNSANAGQQQQQQAVDTGPNPNSSSSSINYNNSMNNSFLLQQQQQLQIQLQQQAQFQFNNTAPTPFPSSTPAYVIPPSSSRPHMSISAPASRAPSFSLASQPASSTNFHSLPRDQQLQHQQKQQQQQYLHPLLQSYSTPAPLPTISFTFPSSYGVEGGYFTNPSHSSSMTTTTAWTTSTTATTTNTPALSQVNTARIHREPSHLSSSSLNSINNKNTPSSSSHDSIAIMMAEAIAAAAANDNGSGDSSSRSSVDSDVFMSMAMDELNYREEVEDRIANANAASSSTTTDSMEM